MSDLFVGKGIFSLLDCPYSLVKNKLERLGVMAYTVISATWKAETKS
jgi:hypothetical protein